MTSIFDSINNMTSVKATGSKKTSNKNGFNKQRTETRIAQLDATITRLNNTVTKRIADNKKTEDELNQVKLEYGILIAGIKAVEADEAGKKLIEEVGMPKAIETRKESLESRLPRLAKTVAGRISDNARTNETINKAKEEKAELEKAIIANTTVEKEDKTPTK